MRPSESLIQSELLVVRYKQGNKAALTELVRIGEHPLYYYVRRFDLDEAESLDVLQDVWLRVLQKLKQLQRPAAFPAWLFKIARSVILGRLRKTARFETMRAYDSVNQVPQEEGESQLHGFASCDIHEALGKLSVSHRECLVLHFIEGLSLRDVSSIIGIPLGTTKSRLYHAKRAIRQLLEAEVDYHGRNKANE